MRIIRYDEEDWTNERTVELRYKGEVVETFYLDCLLQEYMNNSFDPVKGLGIKYKEV